MTPATDKLYFLDLECFYSIHTNKLEVPESEIRPDIQLSDFVAEIDANFDYDQRVTYFKKLFQEFSDQLLAQRLIRKNLVAAPQSKKEKALELFFAIIGVAVPCLGLATKVGHELPHLLHLFKDLGEVGLHASHLYHQQGGDQTALETSQFNSFVHKLVAILTYQFRYELLTLSNDECEKLAVSHFNRIKDSLENLKENECKNQNDVLKRILDLLDPEPIQKITDLVNQYLQNRKERIFRSKSNLREGFFENFLENIKMRVLG